MSSHVEMEKLLAVYESLDAAEQHVVDQHIKTCGVCAARRSAYAEMDTRLAALSDPRPSADLLKRLNAMLQGYRPSSRQRAIAADPLTYRRVLLPAGLLLLLILAAWFIIRVSAPIDRGIAETPSVTPTMTPVAMASPRRHVAISLADRDSWLANRDPGSRMPSATGTGGATAPGSRTIQVTPMAHRTAVVFCFSTAIAHR